MKRGSAPNNGTINLGRFLRPGQDASASQLLAVGRAQAGGAGIDRRNVSMTPGQQGLIEHGYNLGLQERSPGGSFVRSGYYDEFGWHRSFCMSCHDNSNPNSVLKSQVAAYTHNSSWTAFVAEQAVFSAVGIGMAAVERAAAGAVRFAPRGMPSQMLAGRAWESPQLANLGLSKNTTLWRPTAQQTQSAGFQVVVGQPQFTPGGLPVGTVIDVTQGGLMELKSGSSVLNSSYQLRLQTYRSLTENTPYTIQTTRPINSTFQNYLQRWGVKVQPPQ